VQVEKENKKGKKDCVNWVKFFHKLEIWLINSIYICLCLAHFLFTFLLFLPCKNSYQLCYSSAFAQFTLSFYTFVISYYLVFLDSVLTEKRFGETTQKVIGL